VKQFLLKKNPDRDGLVRICGKEYHYLVHVRRVKPGDVFNARLPDSPPACLVKVTVCSINDNTLTGSVKTMEQSGDNPKQQTAIVLFQALPRGTRMDLIIRQAAELEINEVVSFVSEYSTLQKKSIDERLERWRRIIKEARQQSGSFVNTKVRGIQTVNGLLAYWEELRAGTSGETLGLVFSPSAMVYPTESQGVDSENRGSPLAGGENAASGTLQILSNPLAQGSFHRYLNKKPALTALAVGPEGGFSGSELNCFLNAGFKLLSFGTTVLRTETASLFTAAAVKIILQEGALWMLKQQ
jgi:16S rRNA (uracil1498-N3)-methyltransferase